MIDTIRITDVGPRDGLQNEAAHVATADKVALVDALAHAGVAEVEVSSFVSPKWVPQLADAAEVFQGITRVPGVVYSALVPNEQGMSRALDAGVDKVAIFVAASETFSQKNTNASITESIQRVTPVVETARSASLPVRGYLSCIVACPYESAIDPSQVRDVAARLFDIGIDELDLGETLGVAGPSDIERVYTALADIVQPAATTLHLHDTRRTALACAYRAMQLGVRSFDASCGGLGGCPYAPGAAGNLATEDLLYLCEREGIDTGINREKVRDAAAAIRAVLSPTDRSACD